MAVTGKAESVSEYSETRIDVRVKKVLTSACAVAFVSLPELTITLKFCTALIGFVVALSLLMRRMRRWRRRR